MATANPWYGYRRIAVMCRREKKPVNNRMCYRIMKLHGLLQKPRPRAPELHQAAKLYELLPTKPNALWQMDITYIHIPTSGWWYAVTVIDYYSRYLLALHLTPSYCATSRPERELYRVTVREMRVSVRAYSRSVFVVALSCRARATSPSRFVLSPSSLPTACS